jgi:hypothetical protein
MGFVLVGPAYPPPSPCSTADNRILDLDLILQYCARSMGLEGWVKRRVGFWGLRREGRGHEVVQRGMGVWRERDDSMGVGTR